MNPPADQAARSRRIGLFGGSFDPVHRGHLHAARAAVGAFDLDRIVFVPAAQAPHKLDRQLESGSDRLAMLELAIAGEPRFSISALELERGGTSYTVDTVRALPAAIGEPDDAHIYLILGSDNLVGFEHWLEVEALLERVQPIVVERAQEDQDDASARSQALVLANLRTRLSERAWRKLEAGILRLQPVRASSSAVRRRLSDNSRQPLALPRAVEDYIRAHHLYQGSR